VGVLGLRAYTSGLLCGHTWTSCAQGFVASGLLFSSTGRCVLQLAQELSQLSSLVLVKDSLDAEQTERLHGLVARTLAVVTAYAK
jgi:hypothetical protein